MIGPKITLIYQEKSDVSDGQGGCAGVWRNVRPFRGNLMEGISEAGKEIFVNDRNRNEVEYFFILDKPLRTTIANDGRFYKKDIDTYFDIIDIDNLAFINRHLEIRLKKVK